MNKTFEVAFIGGGINSAVGSAHFAAINIDLTFKLVAGCFSRNNEINHETAVKYGVDLSRTYQSIDDLIEKEKGRIDAIIVLSPTDIHFKQVIKIIENKIPVICEKALACSVEEVLLIETALKKYNGFLSVIYNYLGYPMVREIRQIVLAGKIGKVKHIQIEMPQDSFARKNAENKPKVPQQWRLVDGVVPKVSLDLGVHLHMLIKYIINEEPISVVGKCNTHGNFENIIDNVNCIIEYSGNISCNMWYSKIALGYRNGMKISVFGTKGSAEWVQEKPEIISMADDYGNRWILDRGNDNVTECNKSRYTRFKAGHPTGFIEAFANYYFDIANALTKFKNSGVIHYDECFGIDETKEGIKLFEAIQKSCISKHWEIIN